MTDLINLTTGQLHRIIAIKEQIEKMEVQIDSIAGGGDGNGDFPIPTIATRRRAEFDQNETFFDLSPGLQSLIIPAN
jgi:hypothetical protein